MQGRGLKLRGVDLSDDLVRSPLMQGRGLKHLYVLRIAEFWAVAPHAGAWIETFMGDSYK